ncbi:hypothetical protein NM208_g3961 [Fusarium decemcellulare]|uniref:Uncharacterized protein n=1 Tax=Fusarium decemcellulare TaxID=57161 RepID=A0ACC1SMQ5_9HYPO|nr:hypothetical protein NM208_g3961 [Fusarium decemcellulare]
MSPSAVCDASTNDRRRLAHLNGHDQDEKREQTMDVPIMTNHSTFSSSRGLADLQTEQKNLKTANIDSMSSLELCRVINEEDATVARAVQKCLPAIAAAIDVIVPRLLDGGRVIYTGAGTSGRLGILDASEIPPTFSAPAGQFVGLIAGGDYAIRNAVEGAEDSESMGAADLAALSPPINEDDTLIGIASSGRTPYVLGGLKYARSIGAATVGLACVHPSSLGVICDVLIECVTGPEVVTGSTRLKAGTATKMILNMISTGSQIQIGKTFGNLVSIPLFMHRARRVIRMIVPSPSALDIEREDVLDAVLEESSSSLGMVVLNVLGLNCGTSIDGVDVAHCRISSVESSNDVLRLCRPSQEGAATSMAEVCDLNFALGREFSRAIEESGVDMAEVDMIASHGQTLWHQPLGDNRSTLQMAEPAVIARETGRTVVSGFRVAELAAGRQGAPLAGFFEAALLSDQEVTRISQNIGGIGNATVLPASSTTKPRNSEMTYFAFDTGPGNVFIDAAMRILTDGKQHYDRDGVLGAKGEAEIDMAVVDDYLANEPYFQQKPPKTTGRELFSDGIAKSLVDRLKAAGKSPETIIATVTRITTESIARSYEQFVLPELGKDGNIDEIYICGGGAYNPNILKHLQQRFPKSRVLKLDDAPVKIDPSAKEAVLFALLGFLGVCGRTVPIAPGSESTDPAILGVITPGDNYRDVIKGIVEDPGFTGRGVLGRILM